MIVNMSKHNVARNEGRPAWFSKDEDTRWARVGKKLVEPRCHSEVVVYKTIKPSIWISSACWACLTDTATSVSAQSLQPTTAIRSFLVVDGAARNDYLARLAGQPIGRSGGRSPGRLIAPARLCRDRPRHKSSRPNCSMHRHLSPRRCPATGCCRSHNHPSTVDAATASRVISIFITL